MGFLRPTGPIPLDGLRRQPSLGRLEEKVLVLEALLKAEQARAQTLREELAQVRSLVSRMEELETDLVIERDAAQQLVHWLEEAEQRRAGHTQE